MQHLIIEIRDFNNKHSYVHSFIHSFIHSCSLTYIFMYVHLRQSFILIYSLINIQTMDLCCHIIIEILVFFFFFWLFYMLRHILGPPSNIFFHLMLISWMITLSSWMITHAHAWLVLSFRWKNMVDYTLEQRWEIWWHYFENHGNVAECVQKWCTNFGRIEASLVSYVRYLVKKVKETGMLIYKPKRANPKIVRTPENIAAVARKCAWCAININSMSFSTIEHFGEIIETHFV